MTITGRGKATRRGFLGTMSVAGAATVAAPLASAAQNAGVASSPSPTRMAQWYAPPAGTNAAAPAAASAAAAAAQPDWTKPAAMAIPKEGYFQYEQGRYGPVFPKTPANYGFTIIAKVKPGREDTLRAYGKTLEKLVAADPSVLAPLQLHYLRWVLFNIGSDLYFMYQGIFDTDFDKYTEDAVTIFAKSKVHTSFENLEGFPEDWQTNIPAFIKFVRDHQCPSFLEYGEYPYVSATEIKKALKLKSALFAMVEQAQ